jgi:hypothetical protein
MDQETAERFAALDASIEASRVAIEINSKAVAAMFVEVAEMQAAIAKLERRQARSGLQPKLPPVPSWLIDGLGLDAMA